MRWLALFISIFSCCTLAQDLQLMQLSSFDGHWLNPAITGKDNCTIARLIDRHQWLGIKGAPATQSLGLEYPVKRNNQIHGLGSMVFYDKNGPSANMGLYIDYAFHVIVNKRKDIRLSLGLRPGMAQASTDQRSFTAGLDDPVVTGNNISAWIFDAATGFMLYNPVFSIGFAVSHLIPGQQYNHINLMNETTRLFILHSGYRFNQIARKTLIEPSVIFLFNDNFWKQVIFHTKTTWNEEFWGKLSFQTLFDNMGGNYNSLAASIGVNLVKYSFGYQFEVGLNKLQSQHFGSHSFMVQYQLCRNNIPCPTYSSR